MNPYVTFIVLQKHTQLLLFCPWSFQRNYWLLFLQKFFCCFTTWNIIFHRKRMIIVFCTCKFHINPTNFVGVSTWTVWLLLKISITQLSNQIIDYIEDPRHLLDGLMVFLTLLEKLNYLFSKTFNMSLQKSTTCKINSPSFSKYLYKYRRNQFLCVEHKIIMLHHITITKYRHSLITLLKHYTIYLSRSIASSSNYITPTLHHYTI